MNPTVLLLAALLGLLSWLAPNHYPPWTSFHGELAMAAACGLALLAATLRRAAPLVPLSPLTAMALPLAALPLLQLSAGLITYAGDAWLGTAYLLGFALSVWLGQQLAASFGSGRVLQALSGLFITAALVSMGLGLYQWLQLTGLGIASVDMPPNGRPFANLAQPNHLATLLFLGLVGIIVLYESRRIERPTGVIVAAFFTFGLAMTTSRTAWLAMALLVVILLALCRRASMRIRAADVVGLGALFAGWLLVWPALNDALLLSSGRAFTEQASAGPRAILWSTAVEAISRRPWFGYGWDQGTVAQSDVILDRPSWGRIMGSSHNLLLDLLLWTGISLGLALIGGLLLWGGRHLLLARDATSACVLIMLAGVFAHAMVELPLSYTYFLLPTGLLAGLLEAQHPPRWRWTAPRKLMLAPAVVALALLGIIACEYLRIEDNVRTLRLEVARIGTGRIVSEAPQLWLLTQWGDYLRFARVESRPGMSEAEIDHMAVVTRRFPYLRAQFDHAVALALNGRPAEAKVMLQKMCNLHLRTECRQKLTEWRELAQEQYPHLKAVELPNPG
jgi:O-antigen ligase